LLMRGIHCQLLC